LTAAGANCLYVVKFYTGVIIRKVLMLRMNAGKKELFVEHVTKISLLQWMILLVHKLVAVFCVVIAVVGVDGRW